MGIAVIDTNVFRGATRAQLEELRSRGLTLRVSAMAIWESAARTALEGRGVLVGPVRKLARFVDADAPIAPFAGDALEPIRQAALGRPVLTRRTRRAEEMFAAWHLLVSGLDQREWIQLVNQSLRFRTQMDAAWRKLCGRPLSDADRGKWRSERISDAEIVRHLADVMGLDPGSVDRLDGWLRVLARRLEGTATGAMTVGRNDARDNRLLIHVGSGAMLLTQDQALIRALDASGSHQAPWVRTLADSLELPLPPCDPWGEAARDYSRSFVRTGR